jgi:glycosyltransferase involved in cell wall biosynthesis
VVKSNSLEDLTLAMETLLSNPAKINEMSRNALAYVQENLSGDAFYEKFFNMINHRFGIRQTKEDLIGV